MARGGVRAGAGRPKKAEVIEAPADGALLPEVMINYASGKDFLLDVVNLQFEKLGVKSIEMAQRMKAAVEVLPYTDQAKPKLVEAKHDHSWADRVRAAEAKVNSRQKQAEETAEEVVDDDDLGSQ